MLLLYFLLAEDQEAERRRLLIDTLLHLSKRSAASVSRSAGVQPANLSALRRPEGGRHVSPELQERLLAVLGWAGGRPDRDTLHDWEVRDNHGLIALQWILEDPSTAEATLNPTNKSGKHSIDLHWSGNLVQGGAPCQISVGSYLKLPDGTDAESMMSSLVRPETRANRTHQRDTKAKFEGEIAKHTLRQIFEEDKKGTLSFKTGGLFDQRRDLGFTDELLDKLVEDWVCRQARDKPEDLIERLSKIDKVQIGAEEVAPKSMTKLQLKRFINRIAR